MLGLGLEILKWAGIVGGAFVLTVAILLGVLAWVLHSIKRDYVHGVRS